MREGLINVPKFDNDGNSLNHLIEDTILLFANYFGGATAVDVQGAWVCQGKLYREPITQVIAAYDPTNKAHDDFLRDFAEELGRKANQLAMYVRYASGNVEIIDIKPFANKQAA